VPLFDRSKRIKNSQVTEIDKRKEKENTQQNKRLNKQVKIYFVFPFREPKNPERGESLRSTLLSSFTHTEKERR